MPSTNETTKPIKSRGPSYAIATGLLAIGMLLALAGNVYQLMKQRRFEHDVDLIERSNNRQIADLKEAVSGVLEQNLLRYDELNKQLQTVSSSTLEKAKTEATKNSSELAKALERRQRDVIAQISDLRADLRQDTSSKLSKISSDLQSTHSDLKRVASQLETVNGRVDTNFEEIKTELAVVHAEPAPQEQAAPSPSKKKQFWSKLNLFRSSKKKAETSDNDEK